MAVSANKENDVVVLTVSGRLDAEGNAAMEQVVLQALEDGDRRLLFDFENLDYINSSGLRVLIMAYQRLKPLEGRVGICSIRDYIQEIFEISGYNRIFAIFPDRAQGLAALQAREA